MKNIFSKKNCNQLFHKFKCTNVLKMLIEIGADINSLDKNNKTKLFECYNDIDDVKFMIDNGININHVDNYGNTVIYYVKRFDVKKLLIDSGININIKNYKNESYLDFLCSHNNVLIYILRSSINKIIEYIIDNVDDLVISDLTIDNYFSNYRIYNEDIYNLLLNNQIKSKSKSASKISTST